MSMYTKKLQNMNRRRHLHPNDPDFLDMDDEEYEEAEDRATDAEIDRAESLRDDPPEHYVPY